MTQPTDNNAKILMTLAGLAYGDPAAIPKYLAADVLTKGDLEMFWSASVDDAPDNFAFIARRRATNTYYIAIRGTYPNPLSPAYWDDGAQDNPFGTMEPWKKGDSGGASISNGTWRGFWSLLHLASSSGLLQDVLLRLDQGASVWVCGHSLGGTLTPVLALWLKERRDDLEIGGIAFAGMTPGNHAFAALFGPGKPLNGKMARYNNTLDTVGYGWNRVLAAWNFYSPHPNGGWLVKLFLLFSAIRLSSYRFAAIGAETKLKGELRPKVVDNELIAYVIENLYQHLPSTYLALLGAPPLPFDVGFGSVIMERDPSDPPVPHLLSKNAPGVPVQPYYM